MSTFKRNLDIIISASSKGRRGPAIAILMISIGCIMFSFVPLFIGTFVDSVASETDSSILLKLDDLWFTIGITLAVIIIWYILLSCGKAKLYDVLSSARLRDVLMKKYQNLPADYFERHTIGTISSLITEDIPVIMRVAINNFPDAIVQAVVIIFIVIMMCISNVYLGLVYLVLTAISFALTWRAGDSLHGIIRCRQVAISRLNGLFSDSITGHSMIKAYGMEGRMKERFSEIESDYGKTYVRSNNATSYIEPFGRIIDNIGYIASALIGLYMISKGHLSLGMFLSFISYATLIGRPIMTFLDSVYRIQEGSASFDRFSSIVRSKELPDESGCISLDTDSIIGDISFSGVSFGYQKERKAVEGISFEAKAGTITTFVGKAGSGKSTVSDLLMKYRTAGEGRITIDGIDINSISRDDLRKIVGISPQEPWIFEGTIADNIGYAKEGVSREDIVEASKAVGFHEFVMRFPEGYDRVLDEHTKLSSGEAQLLSLARLVLYDPKIIILDESVSDVDPITRYNLLNMAEDWLYGKTVIISATDVSSMVMAHNVVFMKDGRIVDSGIHSELMSRNNEYAELFRSMIVG